jgi:hypothetical protein
MDNPCFAANSVSGVECRVKNNFYLLQTRVTLSQNDRCASQKCSSATVDFYSPALETHELAYASLKGTAAVKFRSTVRNQPCLI